MKKKTLAALLMVIALVSAMMMTACSSKPEEPEEPLTLESFMSEHPDVKAEIDKKVTEGETSGVTVDISGNDIIYTYDLAGIQDMTDDFARSDELKENLQTALDAQADAFKGVASSMESIINQAGVEISGVRVVVNYIYGDEVIVTGTYEPDPEAETAPAEGEDSAG